MAVLDAEPMLADEEDVAALRIFAARAAAELERPPPGRRPRRVARARDRGRRRERRRIGRDLHDGAQQRLMAVRELPHRGAAGRPAATPRRVLDLAVEELSAANAELRDLARGLYPVALAERGLGGALESLTRRLRRPGRGSTCRTSQCPSASRSSPTSSSARR